MGQQQLLLLVLSTVIVGLATVTGIQAFDENQAQASQDALIQKATSIATDVKALHSKPTQLGGITVDNNADPAKIAKRIGLKSAAVNVPGAGDGATLTLTTGSNGLKITSSGSDAAQPVTVTFDPSANDGSQISTSLGTTTGSGGNSGT